MAEIAALGLKIDGVSDVDSATKSLDSLASSAESAENASSKLGSGAQRSGRQVSSANKEAAQATSRLDAAYKQLNGSLAIAAKRMLGYVAATVGIAAASRTLADFEESMAAVSAITRASTEDLAALRDVAKEIGATTEFTASQAADGIKFLGMAGFTAKQSIAAFSDIVDLATASQMGLAQAADIASNIMSAFGISADKAASATDVIAAVTARANTDVTQLGGAMKMVGPVASAMGVSVNDTAAAVGALSDAGIQGSQAGAGLRRILSTLAGPTKAASDAIKRMGINLKDIDPTANSIVDIVRQLSDAGLSAADAFTIFGDRGAPAILALIELLPKLEDLTGELSNVEGEARRMADVMRDQLGGDIKGVMSALEGVVIALGEAGLIAAMRAALQVITMVVRAFTSLIDAIADVARTVGQALAPAFNAIKQYGDIALAAIAGFYAPAVLGGIVALTGVVKGLSTALAVGLVNAIRAVTAAMLANPIGLIIAALVAAGYAVYKFRDAIQEAIGVDVVDIAKRAGNFIVQSFVISYEQITYLWSNFGHMMGAAVVGGVNAAIRAINGLVMASLSGINSLVDALNKIPGVDIGQIGTGLNISELANPFADRLAANTEALKKSMDEIVSTDYLGGLFNKVSEAFDTEPVESFEDQIKKLSQSLGGGGGSGGGLTKHIKQNKQVIDDMAQSLHLAGLRGEELAVAQAKLSLNKYATQEQIDAVETLARALHQAQEAMRQRDKFGEGKGADKYILGDTDPLTGGAFDNQFARYEAEAERERERYQEQLDRLIEARELQIETNRSYDELEALAAQDHANRMNQIDQARTSLMLTTASEGFGALAGILKQSQGEQSSAYKAMFAVSKAFAVANATVNAYDAISKAWASAPFPANLAAVAATTPQVLAVVSAISGTSLRGMAHDGIDSVPKTGTWLLEKGERVTTAQTSAKLDSVLSRIDSRQNSPAANAPVINVVEDPNRGGQTEVTQDARGEYSSTVFVSKIRSNGEEAKVLEATYGLRRIGV